MKIKSLMRLQNSSSTESLRRTGRDIHYPPELVDVVDPFILLVHQGMVEDVFLEDLRTRGVEVQRSSPFVTYSKSESPDKSLVNAEFTNLKTGKNERIASQFLIGCDGAHSKVRKAMPGAKMIGAASTSAWGVLDGKSPI
jgi:2-polyprenyl-6-methoxyphenol hydroxylase-like FAD-dependent oxidoreductase